MTFAQTIKRFSLAAAMVIALTGTATVNSYAADLAAKETRSRFVPANSAQTKLSFVRMPHMALGQIILRAAFAVSTSGCAKFEMPSHQTKIEGNILNIYMNSPTLVSTGMPSHPEYECGGSAQQPYSDIVLSKWLFTENNITKIAIQDLEYGLRKDFIVNLTASYIEIYPASEHDANMAVFQPQSLTYNTTPLKFWFYPQNTVILYVPMANDKDDLSTAITAIADKNGWKPLIQSLPSFRSPITNPNYFYYTTNGDIDVSESAAKIGTIQTTETVYGLIGDEMETKTLDVFMKSPSLYE